MKKTFSTYRGHACKIPRCHGPTSVACPYVHAAFQTKKDIMRFAMEVETDWRSGDTSATHDSKGVVGLLAGHEKARRRLGTRDVDILPTEEGDNIGTARTPLGRRSSFDRGQPGSVGRHDA
jgi:hypothetical protein